MVEKNILGEVNFSDLKFFKKGKVRDIYDFENNLLIIATDRISCFDVILPSLIPYKGKVLTNLSSFWFEFTKDIVENHFISIDVNKFPKGALKYKNLINGRAMLVRKTKALPVECVVRGYLSGSAWKEYKEKSCVCGISLPGGLKESGKLPHVIFTPSTKAESGHDVNITQAEVMDLIGKDLADKIRETSIAIYEKASEYAERKGIIIADTKFEFGTDNSKVILIDEVLTPDSSRFWPKDGYKEGRSQMSFDKQFVRDYLISIKWDKDSSPPQLPQDIIKKTSQKYLDAYEMITGKKLI